MPPKLLITGTTGFLGCHILRAAQTHWHVVGTYHRTSRRNAQRFFGEIDNGRIDLGDFSETKAMMAAVQPSAIIHTAAITDLDYCEQYPHESLRINLQSAVDLANLGGDRDIPFVFTSTDLVFDGTKAPYSEADPVTPINVYGEHKALAEEGILAGNADAAICRLPLLIGYAGLGRETFFQKMITSFRSGRDITLFGDGIRTPVSGAVAAQGLLQVVGSGLGDDLNVAEIERVVGLLHLGGRDLVSLYEMGLLLLHLPALDDRLAIRISLSDAPSAQNGRSFLAARSSNVSLDSIRAYELGYDPPPLRTQVARLLNVVSCASARERSVEETDPDCDFPDAEDEQDKLMVDHTNHRRFLATPVL